MDTVHDVQRIIAKHQHSDGLIGLWPNHQMLGTVSYDFSKYQRHGTHVDVTNRYRMARSYGHYCNMTGYSAKLGSYTDIYSDALANANKIRNPGFEDAGGGGTEVFEHWYNQDGDGAITSDAVVFRSGAASAKLVSGDNPCWVKAYNFYVTAGEVYRVWYWAYGDGVNESRHQVVEHGSGTQIVPITGNGVTAAAWTKVSFSFTVPAGGTIVRIYLHGTTVNGGVVNFDDVDVRHMGAFLGDEGSLFGFAQVEEADTWTDAVSRYLASLYVDGNSSAYIYKSLNDNQIVFRYEAGGVVESLAVAQDSLGLVPYTMTWSKSGDIVSYYMAGVPAGASDTVLGEWSGNLDDTKTLIGAQSTVPAAVWSGGIGLVGLYNEAKPPAEVLYLSKP